MSTDINSRESVGDSVIDVGEDLDAALFARGKALRDIASLVMTKAKQTDLQFALRGLVNKTGFELERLARSPREVEEAARAVRNCLELNLIGRYVLGSKDNLLNWFSLIGQEREDIFSAVLKLNLVDPTALVDERAGIEAEIRKLQALRERHGMPKAKRLPGWSDLAKEYGLKNPYDAYYSLFSKYVHPSTLTALARPRDEPFECIVAEMCVIRAQWYAIDLAVNSLEAIGLDTSVFETPLWVGVAKLLVGTTRVVCPERDEC